ncbi:MAG: NRDE family protein [Cyclobacteriaceae bacterium]|nr:NRDE family protein [Cyclobacteriaceae bacterium]
MCLIALGINISKKYPLLLLANRDEFYRRKTTTAGFWHDIPGIWAGRDLQSGGTWLGVNERGCWAALTNYRDPKYFSDNPHSRGWLVRDYLAGNLSPLDYLNEVRKKSGDFHGFNLLVGQGSNCCYYSNVRDEIAEINDGWHALSNHFLDSPWPKSQRILNKLQAMPLQENLDVEALHLCMYDHNRAEESSLPDTGIPLEMEKMLSPIFIHSPDYGTRCSSILAIGHNDVLIFSEKNYDQQALAVEKTEIRYFFNKKIQKLTT